MKPETWEAGECYDSTGFTGRAARARRSGGMEAPMHARCFRRKVRTLFEASLLRCGTA
jgi:hypothetical protein